MNRVLVLILVCFLGFNTAYSQKSLNDYKYVIVPTKYDFLNEADKYQLNSLTKFLFNKYGFTAFMADENYPQDLQNDNCLALRADVIKEKSFLATKLQVELKDCSNTVVYITKVGQTREKRYDKAFNLALRDAFKSFETTNYKFNDAQPKMALTEPESTESKSKPVVAAPVAVQADTNTIQPESKPVPTETLAIQQESKPTEPTVNSETPIKKTNIDSNVLYAQGIAGGFQIVDSTPKIIMTLYNTGKQNTYIVKDKNAIVYEEDGFWYMSESINGNTDTKPINIKF